MQGWGRRSVSHRARWVFKQARQQASKPTPPPTSLVKGFSVPLRTQPEMSHTPLPPCPPRHMPYAATPHSSTKEIHTPTQLCGSNCFILKYTWADPKSVSLGGEETMKVGDPRARCYQLLAGPPAVCPPWQDRQVWRPGRAQRGWAEEAASAGPGSPQRKGFTSFMAA